MSSPLHSAYLHHTGAVPEESETRSRLNFTRVVSPISAHPGSLLTLLAGVRVIATARRLEAMSNLTAAGITTMILDVADLGSVGRAKNEVVRLTGGTLDILVNNA